MSRGWMDLCCGAVEYVAVYQLSYEYNELCFDSPELQ